MPDNGIEGRLVLKLPQVIARAVYDSLYPDNLSVPPYMEIEQALSEDEGVIAYVVKLTVGNRSDLVRRLNSLRGTLDEILALTSAVQKCIACAHRASRRQARTA